MKPKTALLVIDVQVGMFDESDPVYEGNKLLKNIKNLLEKARVNNIPVIYIQHSNGLGDMLNIGRLEWEIHPHISPKKGELVIQKTTPDSFHLTNLNEKLKELGTDNLIICGIQTEICIDTTCRKGFSLGYDIVLVEDGHSTWNNDSLKAPEIIKHHNQTLSDWFVSLQKAEEVIFKFE